MRIMYIEYMFHTNQVSVMRGWIENRDEVLFVCHTKGVTENHKYCEPFVLGFSKVFLTINSVHNKLLSKKNRLSSFPEAFSGKYGFPPMHRLCKLLREWKPDLVILRDRSVYSVCCYCACRKYRIPAILYNQSPYCPEEIKTDLIHRIIYKITPKVRMTPVYGEVGKTNHNDNTFYVPFVIYPEVSYLNRDYFANGKINIFCIGKYEKRKNQLMLLEIVKELKGQYDVTLTLAGEVSTEHHKLYYQKIRNYIEDNEMQKYVQCYKNYPSDKMEVLYRGSDLFVLPSTGEFASVSQLEAMSYSIPVIVSDTNGTACYIKEGQNGFVFKDNDQNDLKEKILKVIEKRENILRMGRGSYELVEKEHSFEKYRERILLMKTRVESLERKK